MKEIRKALTIHVEHRPPQIPSRQQLLYMFDYCSEQKMISSTKSGQKITIRVLNFEKWQNPHKPMQGSELEGKGECYTLSDGERIHFGDGNVYTSENSEVEKKQGLDANDGSSDIHFDDAVSYTSKQQLSTLCPYDMKRTEKVPTDLSFATLRKGQKSDGDFDDKKTNRNPKGKPAKRDDYIDAMAKFWHQIVPNGKVPISLFGKWRSEHGPDVSLDIVQQVAMSGKKLKSAQGYVAKAISNEAADRRRKNLNEPTESDLDDLRQLVEGD